jgi:ATP-dependent Clp protease ATP-binding subunit ClpA
MLTKELERKFSEATEDAKKRRHEFVTLEHLLFALTSSPKVVEILESCKVNVQKLRKSLQKILKDFPLISEEQLEAYGGYETWVPEFTLASHRLVQRAAMQIRNAGKNQINEDTLLVCFFYETDSPATYSLQEQNLTQFDLINYISHGLDKEGEDSANSLSPSNEEGDSATQENNPLDSFCTNLNQKAIDGLIDPLIGRADVIERIQQVLLRRTKNNPLLIGEPGVGKTALIEGLAQKIVQGDVAEALKNKIIYALDLGSMLAGSKFRGDFEGRLKGVLKEIKKRKNIILFIDEIHTLVGAGATSGGSMDASNLLKPILSRGEFSCIGSTTHSEHRQYFEKDRALNRRFQKIDLSEPKAEEAFLILKGLQKKYEEFHHVSYSDDSLRSAIELSQKHIQGSLLPDKAIDVIDEAASSARLQAPGKELLSLGVRDIERTVSRMTNLPLTSISSQERNQLKELDKKLKAQIFGQDEAIDKVVASLKLARAGLSITQKPIGSFLFVGPTGVGKTEVTKQLAELQGLPFHRFDMSEYMEKHAVARLIGAPPGYVGYESGGLLTEAVTKTPYCVILLDEIEKAHSDIMGSLLQVMDAGRLTDGQGRVAHFKNVILIMTSNAGAFEVSKGAIGLVEDEGSNISLDIIKKTFAPEFINRLDAIVQFKELNQEILLKVVEKFVNDLKMILTNKNVELTTTTEVLKWLLKKGYNKAYGARPLGRTVDEHLKKALVDELLFGRLAEGGRVQVDVSSEDGDKETLKFHFSTSPLTQNQITGKKEKA